MTDFVHCDDLIDDASQPECLRTFLEYHRRPAIEKDLPEAKEPVLFATLRADHVGSSYMGHWVRGEPAMEAVPLMAGQKVRVVMASRFGDVGITPDLKAARGYVLRLPVTSLDNFTDK